jgi:type IV secretory pathway VirJ component
VLLTLFTALLFVSTADPHPRASYPVVEVPPAPGARPAPGCSDVLAVVVSGDGGWGRLVSDVADTLAEAGVPVVGLNALRYFWTRRSADEAGEVLSDLLERHAGCEGRERVALVGYSRGADVLPFMVRRLPRAERRRVALVALLGPGLRASFTFHLLDWVRDREKQSQPAVGAELEKLRGVPLLCVYGADEPHSACPELPPGLASVEEVPGDHHLGSDYHALGQRILDALANARPRPEG